MRDWVEAFERCGDLFSEPILLLSSSGRLEGANRAARQSLIPDVARELDVAVFDLLAESRQDVLAYLRLCSRSPQPIPGKLTFHGSSAPQEARRYSRCYGCMVRTRHDQEHPLVALRFVAAENPADQFIALNHQLAQQRREIARRLAAEAEAQRQRELFRVTLSSIGDAVIATDLDGCITFMNEVASGLTCVPQSLALGRPIEDVFVIRNEYTGALVESPVAKVLREGAVVELANHTVLIRPDGTAIPIDDSGAPIRDQAGRMLGVVLVFHEISESRRLERELSRQTAALKQADRPKDEFLAVLAHELRNPLAPIRNGLQIARMRTNSDSIVTRALDMMQRQLSHLVRLVNDLMDVSRVTRGVIELKRTPVLIEAVLARSVEAVRGDLEARRHELVLEVLDPGLSVDADADRLTQVFSNLLGNSAKYSTDGGRIKVSVRKDNSAVRVEVTDTGIGIPSEHLEQVFEMFSQVRIHQGRSEGGLGIGLALVRRLVEMHGGTVHASSGGLQAGSTFTVCLPLSLAGPQLPAPVASEHPDRESLRVLIADDNSDCAESLRLLLQLRGHVVDVALNGAEAVAKARILQPALVFMDIGMPEMDGIEATKLIRMQTGGERAFIVALTGWGLPQDQERTRSAGADRHMTKPINPDDLAEIVEAAQQRSHA